MSQEPADASCGGYGSQAKALGQGPAFVVDRLEPYRRRLGAGRERSQGLRRGGRVGGAQVDEVGVVAETFECRGRGAGVARDAATHTEVGVLGESFKQRRSRCALSDAATDCGVGVAHQSGLRDSVGAVRRSEANFECGAASRSLRDRRQASFQRGAVRVDRVAAAGEAGHMGSGPAGVMVSGFPTSDTGHAYFGGVGNDVRFCAVFQHLKELFAGAGKVAWPVRVAREVVCDARVVSDRSTQRRRARLVGHDVDLAVVADPELVSSGPVKRQDRHRGVVASASGGAVLQRRYQINVSDAARRGDSSHICGAAACAAQRSLHGCGNLGHRLRVVRHANRPHRAALGTRVRLEQRGARRILQRRFSQLAAH